METNIGARLRWRGLTGGCDGSRVCGECFGICIFFGFTEPQILNSDELEAGGAHATIKITSPSTLYFLCKDRFDNGNGTVTITDDFYIETSVCKKLNCNSIKVLAGTYTIDYSNSEFATTVFNIESN
jgi:hypothetical protein